MAQQPRVQSVSLNNSKSRGNPQRRNDGNDRSPGKLSVAKEGTNMDPSAEENPEVIPQAPAPVKAKEPVLPPQKDPLAAKFVTLATKYIELVQNTINRTVEVDQQTAKAHVRMVRFLLENQTPAICQLMWDLHSKYADTCLSDRYALMGIKYLSAPDAAVVRHVYNDYRFYIKRKSGTLDRHGLTRQGINAFQMLAFLEQKGRM